MEFTYGPGVYLEDKKRFEGRIILSEHKLFLKGKNGDLARTYIPLEKIERLRLTRQGLQVHVRPTLSYRYVALISGKRKHMTELIRDLVQRRGLKKQFLKQEWIEEDL